MEDGHGDAKLFGFLPKFVTLVIGVGIQHQKTHPFGGELFFDALELRDALPDDGTAIALNVQDNGLCFDLTVEFMRTIVLIRQAEIGDTLGLGQGRAVFGACLMHREQRQGHHAQDDCRATCKGHFQRYSRSIDCWKSTITALKTAEFAPKVSECIQKAPQVPGTCGAELPVRGSLTQDTRVLSMRMGMKRATTMAPTTIPISMMRMGSMRLVNWSTVALTSES